MLYDFKCENHGLFEVEQDMLTEHKAVCPQCGEVAQRIYSHLKWIWANSAYRPDGSLRQDKDYAKVMKG